MDVYFVLVHRVPTVYIKWSFDLSPTIGMVSTHVIYIHFYQYMHVAQWGTSLALTPWAEVSGAVGVLTHVLQMPSLAVYYQIQS